MAEPEAGDDLGDRFLLRSLRQRISGHPGRDLRLFRAAVEVGYEEAGKREGQELGRVVFFVQAIAEVVLRELLSHCGTSHFVMAPVDGVMSLQSKEWQHTRLAGECLSALKDLTDAFEGLRHDAATVATTGLSCATTPAERADLARVRRDTESLPSMRFPVGAEVIVPDDVLDAPAPVPPPTPRGETGEALGVGAAAHGDAQRPVNRGADGLAERARASEAAHRRGGVAGVVLRVRAGACQVRFSDRYRPDVWVLAKDLLPGRLLPDRSVGVAATARTVAIELARFVQKALGSRAAFGTLLLGGSSAAFFHMLRGLLVQDVVARFLACTDAVVRDFVRSRRLRVCVAAAHASPAALVSGLRPATASATSVAAAAAAAAAAASASESDWASRSASPVSGASAALPSQRADDASAGPHAQEASAAATAPPPPHVFFAVARLVGELDWTWKFLTRLARHLPPGAVASYADTADAGPGRGVAELLCGTMADATATLYSSLVPFTRVLLSLAAHEGRGAQERDRRLLDALALSSLALLSRHVLSVEARVAGVVSVLVVSAGQTRHAAPAPGPEAPASGAGAEAGAGAGADDRAHPLAAAPAIGLARRTGLDSDTPPPPSWSGYRVFGAAERARGYTRRCVDALHRVTATWIEACAGHASNVLLQPSAAALSNEAAHAFIPPSRAAARPSPGVHAALRGWLLLAADLRAVFPDPAASAPALAFLLAAADETFAALLTQTAAVRPSRAVADAHAVDVHCLVAGALLFLHWLSLGHVTGGVFVDRALPLLHDARDALAAVTLLRAPAPAVARAIASAFGVPGPRGAAAEGRPAGAGGGEAGGDGRSSRSGRRGGAKRPVGLPGDADADADDETEAVGGPAGEGDTRSRPAASPRRREGAPRGAEAEEEEACVAAAALETASRAEVPIVSLVRWSVEDAGLEAVARWTARWELKHPLSTVTADAGTASCQLHGKGGVRLSHVGNSGAAVEAEARPPARAQTVLAVTRRLNEFYVAAAAELGLMDFGALAPSAIEALGPEAALRMVAARPDLGDWEAPRLTEEEERDADDLAEVLEAVLWGGEDSEEEAGPRPPPSPGSTKGEAREYSDDDEGDSKGP